MKFEFVQLPDSEPAAKVAARRDDEAVRRDEAGGDPVAAVNAAAARLIADARSEGERITASLGELASLAEPVSPAEPAAVPDPAPPHRRAKPPSDFRSDRFSKGGAP